MYVLQEATDDCEEVENEGRVRERPAAGLQSEPASFHHKHYWVTTKLAHLPR